jgi:membrane-associated progesterone receptor component
MSFNPLETPLNSLLALSIAYNLFRVAWPSIQSYDNDKVPTDYSSSYNWMPAKHQETTVFKNYTPRSLEPFNGQNGGKILLAIDRNVFDVTTGGSFYGPRMNFCFLVEEIIS